MSSLTAAFGLDGDGDQPGNAHRPAGWLEICLRTAHAPFFANGTGKRTFIHVEGECLPIARTSMEGRTDSNFPMFPVGALKTWEWRHPSFLEEPDCPLILMADRTGKRVLGMADLPQGMIFTNVAKHVRCMHSDACLLPVELGQTFTPRGAAFSPKGALPVRRKHTPRGKVVRMVFDDFFDLADRE